MRIINSEILVKTFPSDVNWRNKRNHRKNFIFNFLQILLERSNDVDERAKLFSWARFDIFPDSFHDNSVESESSMQIWMWKEKVFICLSLLFKLWNSAQGCLIDCGKPLKPCTTQTKTMTTTTKGKRGWEKLYKFLFVCGPERGLIYGTKSFHKEAKRKLKQAPINFH